MHYLAFVLLLVVPGLALGQQDAEVSVSTRARTDSVRAMYIQSFPDHFFIWPVLKQRKLDFEIANVNGKRQELGYKSNKPYSFGIGMYLFELGFELAFAIPLDEQSKRLYGESDARDLQLNILGKRWGIDAYHQRYNGFYIDDPSVDLTANTPYRQRPDIETRNIGITGNYTFNNKKFSFRSAYNFGERQLLSAGSFIISGSLSSFRVRADSALIGSQYSDSYGERTNLYRVRTTMLGIAPGYAYNLIYKGFFLNGTLSVGPAHNWLAYTLQGAPDKHEINFTAFVAARLALGYNGERFFGGLSFSNQGRTSKFENLELTNTNSSFKILFGYRFRETGFLKERIWDLPKMLLNQ